MRGLYYFVLPTTLLLVCYFHSATGYVRGGIVLSEQDATETTDNNRELQDSSGFKAFKAPFFNNGILSSGNECTYEPAGFDSDLIMEFNGNPELISDTELKVLEDAFVETFNNLAGGLCDSSFRTVASVNISGSEIVETRRRMQEVPGLTRVKALARRFSFHLFVRGNCKGCMQESALFVDDAFRRRDLQSINGARFKGAFQDRRPIDLPTKSYSFFSKNPFNCDCVKEGTLSDRSVRSEEFNGQFSAELGVLNAAGSLPNVDGSFGVTEVKQVECPAEFDNFDSEVIVDATGDPEQISPEELNLMRDLFLQSYKMTSEDVCDTEFRVLTTATVEIESRRLLRTDEEAERDLRIGSLSGSTMLSASDLLNRAAESDSFRINGPTPALLPAVNNAPALFRPFSFRFRVSGKCKGCKSEARLFDDAVRRRLAEEQPDFFMDPSRPRRELAFVLNNDTCFCGINAPQGLPDTDTFRKNLDQAIQTEQAAAASFPNIGAVIQVVQIDRFMPSSAPSLSPSISPSNSPIVVPSISPSNMPSNGPSIAPSQRPSGGPSEEPSRPTIPTESPVPSPQPSMAPTDE
jgi:hypothetical protein